jgi:putative transposase
MGPVRRWLARLGVDTLFIEPSSPWENGYGEFFNGKIRDELLARETFYLLKEAPVLIEHWRRPFNHVRPHSVLDYRSLALWRFSILLLLQGSLCLFYKEGRTN